MKGFLSLIHDNNSGMALNYLLTVITGSLIMVFFLSAGCTRTALVPK